MLLHGCSFHTRKKSYLKEICTKQIFSGEEKIYKCQSEVQMQGQSQPSSVSHQSGNQLINRLHRLSEKQEKWKLQDLYFYITHFFASTRKTKINSDLISKNLHRVRFWIKKFALCHILRKNASRQILKLKIYKASDF